MDADNADIDRSKATVILCYGNVAFYAQPSQLTASLDTVILRGIIPHFNSSLKVNFLFVFLRRYIWK